MESDQTFKVSWNRCWNPALVVNFTTIFLKNKSFRLMSIQIIIMKAEEVLQKWAHLPTNYAKIIRSSDEGQDWKVKICEGERENIVIILDNRKADKKKRYQTPFNESYNTTYASDFHLSPVAELFSISAVRLTHPAGCPCETRREFLLFVTTLKCERLLSEDLIDASSFLFWKSCASFR